MVKVHTMSKLFNFNAPSFVFSAGYELDEIFSELGFDYAGVDGAGA